MAERQVKRGEEEYSANMIKVLKGLEAVRKRPAMYIGSTDERGFHHLLWEIVDNSVDEALAGHCKKIVVRLLPDAVAEVEDDGRGIPVDIHEETGIPGVILVFTELHAGGKFEKGVYKVSGGLHGVGASVVNALSEWLEVWVWRDEREYYVKFEKGKPKSEKPIVKREGVQKRGTRVRFKPDPEIFTDVEKFEFDIDIVAERLREISFLVPELKIELKDERGEQKQKMVFVSKEGLVGLVKNMVGERKTVLKNPISFEWSGKWSGNGKGVDLKISLSFTYLPFDELDEEEFLSFVNTIRTGEGGTHVEGFRTALTKAINQFVDRVKIPKMKERVQFDGNDVRSGLVGALSVFIPDPQFEGQTKEKLGNAWVKSAVQQIVYEKLVKYFEANPKEVEAIVRRAWQTREFRQKEKELRKIYKEKIEKGLVLPGKLADCQKTGEEAELFLVEGESAGGSAKQARDRRFQAILPLKGKILNVEKASKRKMLEHEEIQAIISALGCGYDQNIDTSRLRYGKIIIMTDADVDGSHIRTLLLTFFWKYMRPLVEQGRIYIAQPPLYRVRIKDKDIYLKDDRELKTFIIARALEKLGVKDAKKVAKQVVAGKIPEEVRARFQGKSDDEILKELEEKGKEGIVVQRFKGLGEMSPAQLWETTLNPSTRTLKQVTVKDAEKAEYLFMTLMGDKTQERKEFIFRHALEVKNLDI